MSYIPNIDFHEYSIISSEFQFRRCVERQCHRWLHVIYIYIFRIEIFQRQQQRIKNNSDMGNCACAYAIECHIITYNLDLWPFSIMNTSSTHLCHRHYCYFRFYINYWECDDCQWCHYRDFVKIHLCRTIDSTIVSVRFGGFFRLDWFTCCMHSILDNDDDDVFYHTISGVSLQWLFFPWFSLHWFTRIIKISCFFTFSSIKSRVPVLYLDHQRKN